MFTTEDHEFIDFLFGKLTCLTDTEMIDLQDDDSCDDHIQFQQLEISDNVWHQTEWYWDHYWWSGGCD